MHVNVHHRPFVYEVLACNRMRLLAPLVVPETTTPSIDATSICRGQFSTVYIAFDETGCLLVTGERRAWGQCETQPSYINAATAAAALVCTWVFFRSSFFW